MSFVTAHLPEVAGMEHNEEQPLDVTLVLLGPGQSDVQHGQAHTEQRLWHVQVGCGGGQPGLYGVCLLPAGCVRQPVCLELRLWWRERGGPHFSGRVLKGAEGLEGVDVQLQPKV
jgi:hypothetical protein